MGNVNAGSSNAGYRKICSVLQNDLIHLLNFPSHIKWLGKIVSNSTGLTLPNLWDVNRLLFNYFYYLEKTSKKIMDFPNSISKVTEVAYIYLSTRLDVVTNNPESWNQISNATLKCAQFLQICLIENHLIWTPEIHAPPYVVHFNNDQMAMKYDMGEQHTAQLFNKIRQITATTPQQQPLLTQALNNNDEIYQQQTINRNTVNGLGGALHYYRIYINDVRDLFTCEINYLMDQDHNGNPVHDNWRRRDYSGWFRRTGIPRETAAELIQLFSDEHIINLLNDLDALDNSINNLGVNVLFALSDKFRIYSQNIICGSIRQCVHMDLRNNDTLRVMVRRPDPEQNNLNQDQEIPVAQPVMDVFQNISIGDYYFPSYNGLVQQLLNNGMTELGFRMRIINPPPPAQQAPGGNQNHPAMQDIVDLWTILGGPHGDNHAYDNGIYILVENNHEFEIHGAESSIRHFINLPPTIHESIINPEYNVENQNENGHIPPGPNYMLIGPLLSAQDLNNMKNEMKTTFMNTTVPNILASCWQNLKYNVPVQ